MPKAKLSRQSSMSVTMLLLLLVQTLCAESMLSQRIQWQKTPIAITLSVGEERLVHFRAPVSVGLPATLESVLRTQTVNGTVYLMAKAAFGSTRVMVREIDSGQVYLFDLSASTSSGTTSGVTSGNTAPIVVTLDEPGTAENRLGETDNGARHGYVSLTRFAAQQLYAPMRLLSAVPGIVRVPVQRGSVALVPGDTVEAQPLVAWRAGHLYVTALKLSNRSRKAQVLDPRTLRGAWLSAAFQHARLLPAGDEADTTAVYLVSAQPFAASL